MDTGSFVLLCMVISVGILVMRFLLSRTPKVSRGEIESFAKNLPANFGYPYYLDGSGYGINALDKKILIQANGKKKIYDRSNIREIKWTLQEAGKVYGTAPVLMENRKLKKEAYNSSGIFITTADIDNPVWHIKYSSEHELRRSFEILQQFLNGELMDYQEYLKQRG